MPFELVQYPFVAGIDEKKDPLNLEAPSFKQLINCVRKKTGRIEKRRGNVSLSLSAIIGSPRNTFTLTAPSIAVVRRMFGFSGGLYLTDGTYLYSNNGYGSPGTNVWSRKDLIPGCEARWKTVAESSTLSFDPDACVVAGKYLAISWYAADSGTGSTRLSIIEIATGDPVISDFFLFSGAGRPRMVAIGNLLFVVHTNSATGNTIVCAIIDLTAPTPTASLTTLVSDAASNSVFDIATDGQGLYFWLVYTVSSGTNRLTLKKINTSGTTVATGQVSAVVNSASAVGVHVSTGDRAWVTYSTFEGGGWSFEVFTASTCVGYAGPQTIDATVTANRVGVCELGVDGIVNGAYAMAEIGGGAGSGQIVKGSYITDTPSASSLMNLRNYQMLSRPWLDATTNRIYVLTLFDSLAQPSQNIMDVGSQAEVRVSNSSTICRPVANIAPRSSYRTNGIFLALNGGMIGHVPILPSTTIDGSTYALAGLTSSQKDQVEIIAITADFAARGLWTPSETGGLYVFSAGAPCVYDGIEVSELSHANYPENTAALVGNAAGGNMVSTGAAGGQDWQYCFVYRWVDAKGNIVRSAPSIPQTVRISAATAAGSVSITGIPCLHATLKQKSNDSQRPQVFIEIYRTLVGPGPIFFRVNVGPADASVANDPTADSVNFTDVTADSVTPGDLGVGDGRQPTLYTTGGVLENLSPPSFVCLVEHKGRLFGLSGDGRTVWYTRIITPGESPAFHDTLTIQIDEGGDGVALFSLDDFLLVFKRGTIFAIRGDGPADNGNGVDYVVQKVPGDVGCIEPRSIVLVPDGVLFQSQLGIHLLNRSIQVEWIGGPVVDTLAANPEITSAVRIEEQHQVRFTCAGTNHLGGRILVWDYFHNAWSVFSMNGDGVAGHDGVGVVASAVISAVPFAQGNTRQTYYWAGHQPGFLGTPWMISQEVADGIDYRDSGAFVSMTIQTGQIRLTGVQGYQRARRVHVLANSPVRTDHQLNVRVSYDYEALGAAADETNVTFTDAMLGAFSSAQDQIAVELVRQKVETIQVQLQDLAPLGAMGIGQGPSLSGLGVQVATKRGAYRVPPSQVR